MCRSVKTASLGLAELQLSSREERGACKRTSRRLVCGLSYDDHHRRPLECRANCCSYLQRKLSWRSEKRQLRRQLYKETVAVQGRYHFSLPVDQSRLPETFFSLALAPILLPDSLFTQHSLQIVKVYWLREKAHTSFIFFGKRHWPPESLSQAEHTDTVTNKCLSTECDSLTPFLHQFFAFPTNFSPQEITHLICSKKLTAPHLKLLSKDLSIYLVILYKAKNYKRSRLELQKKKRGKNYSCHSRTEIVIQLSCARFLYFLHCSWTKATRRCPTSFYFTSFIRSEARSATFNYFRPLWPLAAAPCSFFGKLLSKQLKRSAHFEVSATLFSYLSIVCHRSCEYKKTVFAYLFFQLLTEFY